MTHEAKPEVSVLIVSYNTRDLTTACIRSVLGMTRGARVEVIVVDNASSDGSAEAIARDFPSVTLIKSGRNLGFAGANNLAMRASVGQWLLLLNSDTELREDAISSVLDYAMRQERVGVVGCRLIGADGVQQSSLFRCLTLSQLAIHLFLPHRTVRKIRWLDLGRYPGIDLAGEQSVEVVAGAFMLAPREVYETVGGMDESFFMYGEEAEWCWRIRRAGRRVLYFPGARVVHYGGASALKERDRMTLAMARSQVLFMLKTRGPLVAWAANAMMAVRELPRLALHGILKIVPLRVGGPARATLEMSRRRFALHASGLTGRLWRDSHLPES